MNFISVDADELPEEVRRWLEWRGVYPGSALYLRKAKQLSDAELTSRFSKLRSEGLSKMAAMRVVAHEYGRHFDTIRRRRRMLDRRKLRK